MTFDDTHGDEVVAAVAGLNTPDVSLRHAQRLRRHCHAALQSQCLIEEPHARPAGTLFRRVIGPALGGAWCLAYLVEIVRRAAAMYGLRP